MKFAAAATTTTKQSDRLRRRQKRTLTYTPTRSDGDSFGVITRRLTTVVVAVRSACNLLPPQPSLLIVVVLDIITWSAFILHVYRCVVRTFVRNCCTCICVCKTHLTTLVVVFVRTTRTTTAARKQQPVTQFQWLGGVVVVGWGVSCAAGGKQ